MDHLKSGQVVGRFREVLLYAYIPIHTYTYIYARVYIYIYTYTYITVHMHIYIDIYTYIYTPSACTPLLYMPLVKADKCYRDSKSA